MNAKQKAGRLGGLRTVEKRGKAHMSAIGKKGAATTWKLYAIQPVDSSGYALVERATGKIRAIWCTPWIVLCLAMLALSLAGCAVPTRTPATATPSLSPTLTSSPAATTAKAEQLRAIYATLTPSACVVANTRGEVLNIRKSPSLQAEIIGGLVPGQRLTVLVHGQPWQKITTGELTGFIYSQYCEVTK